MVGGHARARRCQSEAPSRHHTNHQRLAADYGRLADEDFRMSGTHNKENIQLVPAALSLELPDTDKEDNNSKPFTLHFGAFSTRPHFV